VLPDKYSDYLTYAVASSDTAAALAANKITRTPAGGGTARARYMRIQPLTNAIKWCIGATPVIGAGNLGHLLAANSEVILEDASAIANFSFISAVSGNHGACQVTVGF